jgi:hypothetical protein
MNVHYKINKNTITSLMKHKTNKNGKMHIKVNGKHVITTFTLFTH